MRVASQGRPCGVRAGPACSGLDLCARTSPGRDTFIVTLGNAITSILAGFAIFSVLGYMSQELGVPVDQVAKAGGQAGQSCGVWVCVGRGSMRVHQPGHGWLRPVRVWMCAHTNERIIAGLWVSKGKGGGRAKECVLTCVCRYVNTRHCLLFCRILVTCLACPCESFPMSGCLVQVNRGFRW